MPNMQASLDRLLIVAKHTAKRVWHVAECPAAVRTLEHGSAADRSLPAGCSIGTSCDTGTDPGGCAAGCCIPGGWAATTACISKQELYHGPRIGKKCMQQDASVYVAAPQAAVGPGWAASSGKLDHEMR